MERTLLPRGGMEPQHRPGQDAATDDAPDASQGAAGATELHALSTQAVLLDVDGTLADSNDLHAAAWQEALAHAGFPVTFSDVRPLIGMGGDKLLPRLTGLDAESGRGKELAEQRGELFLSRYLPKVRSFPHARDLVLRMRDDGYILVVATSAKKDEMHALLERIGLADLDLDKTSSDDADASKPEPDIICVALARARCEPTEALFLGDSPYDVEASRRAGVRMVALRCGGFPEARLAGAVAMYDDPADLLDRYESSPFFGAAGAFSPPPRSAAPPGPRAP